MRAIAYFIALASALAGSACALCAAAEVTAEAPPEVAIGDVVAPVVPRSALKQPGGTLDPFADDPPAAEKISRPQPHSTGTEAAPFGPWENGPLGMFEADPCNPEDCQNEGYFPFGFHFRHAARGEPGRHIGLGQPLEGTSWLNRPWHADWFVGGMFADELISDRIDQRDGFFGGLRLGYDFDHYWGWEVRWQDPTFDLVENGLSTTRAAYDYFLDVELLYYPWGDARWRPYCTVGLGFTGFRFIDDKDRQIDQALLNVPIGVGLKYLLGKNCVLRFDLVDNIAFSSAELETMNNFQFTGGMEFRFGGTRTSYYPWNPSIHLW